VDAEHNRENAKTRLAMPVMTVGGVASFGAALKGQVEPLVDRLQHVMIEDCGHYIAEEQPAKLADELLRFFAE
jgi:pimeloyl-ACP methyl ester carboxylesterase